MCDKLQQAIDLVTKAFCGSDVILESKCDEKYIVKMISKSSIRDAIKYVSLNEDDRKVWDDKTMPKSLKYQTIPQVDISVFEGDYTTTPLIQIKDDDLLIHIVFSASRESMDVVIHKREPLYDKFLEMSWINTLLETLNCSSPDNIRINIQDNIIILGGRCYTHMISNEIPKYNVQISELYKEFKKNPDKLYVPHRRGWSRVVNMIEYDNPGHSYHIQQMSTVVAMLHPKSCITTWDGHSMKRESHEVLSESVVNLAVQYCPSPTQMRVMKGTHEHMEDVDITEHETESDEKFYAIWTIKGINIDGYEFNMS